MSPTSSVIENNCIYKDMTETQTAKCKQLVNLGRSLGLLDLCNFSAIFKSQSEKKQTKKQI